jgi:hypothetical protein
MKKLVYIVACGAVVASFAACKGQKKETVATAPVAAVKEAVEVIKVPNYDNFIEAIVFEETLKTRPVERSVASTYRTIARSYNNDAPMIALNSSAEVKELPENITIIEKSVSPDGKIDKVVVIDTLDTDGFEATTFEKFDDVNHAAIAALDTLRDTKEWKIRTRKNKEVWRAVNSDGGREVLKFRENRDRDFVKIKAAGERNIVKNLEFGNRVVDKMKMDGDREIYIDRIMPYGEVIKVVENGKVTKAVKTRDTRRKASIKELFDDDKEFVKVLERRNGQDEIVKTLVDGERSREVMKDLVEHNRTIHKVKRDGNRVVEKARNETSADVFKVKKTIDGETTKIKEIVER